MHNSYIVDDDYHNARLDRWFKQKVINVPHSLIERIIRQNKIKLNKKKTKSSQRLQKGDLIEIFDISKFKARENDKIFKYIPKKEELYKYEDYVIENNDNFIIINKPAGIPVQSGTKSFKNITDILKKSKYFQASKPFIVHRIDKETSGILIIAKNRKFAQLFTTLFRIRKIHKTYLALAYGKINKSTKNMRDELTYIENKKKIIQKAITNIKIIKSNDELSYVELNPITGRKHQLRRQLLNLGNPIIGDEKYYLKNFKKIKTKNLMLHSYKIKFMINNIQYSFKAKYTNFFEKLLKEKF
tara:strand:- start:807 stop:1706 length:900 start_codon:yes stop_codon:yes gene_type:complete